MSSVSNLIQRAVSLIATPVLNTCPIGENDLTNQLTLHCGFVLIEVVELLSRFVEPRYPAAKDACSFSGLRLPGNNGSAYLRCVNSGKSTAVKLKDLKTLSSTVLKWASLHKQNSTIQNRRVMQTIIEHLFKRRQDYGSMDLRIPLGMIPGYSANVNCGELEEGHCPHGLVFDFFRQKCDKQVLFGNGVRRLISLSKTNRTFVESALHFFQKSLQFIKAIPDLTLTLLAMAKSPVSTAIGLAKVLGSSAKGKIEYSTLLEEAARNVDVERMQMSDNTSTGAIVAYARRGQSVRSGRGKMIPNEMLDNLMSSL
uniref:Uncharacterized protein n=1 Tax=Trichuris muris TaxID=70415 RepID=A0A5S6QW10_TRIMR